MATDATKPPTPQTLALAYANNSTRHLACNCQDATCVACVDFEMHYRAALDVLSATPASEGRADG